MNRSFSLIFGIVIFSSLFLEARTFPAKAACKVFVANAFNDYVATKANTQDPAEITRLYHEVLATNKNDSEFTRVHQILLHEIVEVIDQKGPELLVRCSDSFSQTTPDEKPWCTYAVLAEEFVYLDELDHQEYLPQPLEWWNKDSYKPKSTVFTLGFSKDHRTRGDESDYSPGTRFIIKTYYPLERAVEVFALKKTSFLTPCWDTDWFYLSEGTINHPSTNAEKETCMLEQFFHSCGGLKTVTTVWGGRSAHRRQKFEKFANKDEVKKELLLPGTEKKVAGFTRPEEVGVSRGFDAKGLDNMVKRICQLPDLFKNTHTDFLYHQRILAGEPIGTLDAIQATPGYFGRVISVEENLIQDIRSYTHHHGAARIVKLSDNFEGIETYEELAEAYRTGKPLRLWNDDKTRIIIEYQAYRPETYKPGMRVWSIGKFHSDYTDEEWARFASLHTPSQAHAVSPAA